MRTPDFRHLLNLLTLEGPQDPRFVEEVLELVGLTTDARGSALYGAPSYEAINGAAAVNTISGMVVPAGDLFIVPIAHMYHTDAAATHYLSMEINHATNVVVRDASAISQFTRANLGRTVVVPGGASLRVQCSDGVGAGNTLHLRYMYFQVKPGNYCIPF
jgi:hypothetical protein